MMDIQFIAITMTDGSLGIMQFVTDDDAGVIRDATDDAINAEIAKGDLPSASWRRIAPADIPTDRTYRDAWVDNGTAIVIDPTKKAAIDAARPPPT